MSFIVCISSTVESIAVYMWCIAALFFLLLEIGNPGLLFFSAFSCGAMAAAMISLFCNEPMWQLLSFFGCSISGMVLLQSIVRKYWSKMHSSERTNVYALKGKHGFVLRVISSQVPGLVDVGGERWIAFSLYGHTIPEGYAIEVIDIKGAHLIVKSIISVI